MAERVGFRRMVERNSELISMLHFAQQKSTVVVGCLAAVETSRDVTYVHGYTSALLQITLGPYGRVASTA